jgi:G:T-mismatch repair DNA endonuclease (very short patch repair protein)
VKHNFARSGPFIGIGGLAVAAFLYGYSAIALPSVLHSIVMPVVWLVLFVVGCAWFTRHPVGVIAVPVLATLLWFVLLIGFGAHA